MNATCSDARVTHIPSGFIVSAQDDKSQVKNRAEAMRLLRTKLACSFPRNEGSPLASLGAGLGAAREVRMAPNLP